MVGYGIYLFVEYKKASSSGDDSNVPAPSSEELIQLGRPMLMAVSLAANIFDKLPKAWYEDLFCCVFHYFVKVHFLYWIALW